MNNLNDQQRNTLAVYLDGKASKRLATRAEVADYLQGIMSGTLAAAEFEEVPETAQQTPAHSKGAKVGQQDARLPNGVVIDQPNGDPALVDKSPSYYRGHNKVKNGLGSRP